jgi:hypothetical protein
MDMSLLPPSFIDSVVALGNIENGVTRWVASGFLYGAKEGSQTNEDGSVQPTYSLWLVTNRHVSQTLTAPMIRFDATSLETSVELELSKISLTELWTSHENLTFDVSVMRLNIDFLKSIHTNISFFEEQKSSATLKELKELGVHEGNGGFILGFPLGLVEGPKGSVIARKSSIARIRNAYENQSRVILIDGSVFPGNSGGPAVIHPEPIVIQGTSPIRSAYLIGVVASYVPFRETAISTQTGRERMVFEENTGLTNVFSVDCIVETIQQAKLVEVQERKLDTN